MAINPTAGINLTAAFAQNALNAAIDTANTPQALAATQAQKKELLQQTPQIREGILKQLNYAELTPPDQQALTSTLDRYVTILDDADKGDQTLAAQLIIDVLSSKKFSDEFVSWSTRIVEVMPEPARGYVRYIADVINDVVTAARNNEIVLSRNFTSENYESLCRRFPFAFTQRLNILKAYAQRGQKELSATLIGSTFPNHWEAIPLETRCYLVKELLKKQPIDSAIELQIRTRLVEYIPLSQRNRDQEMLTCADESFDNFWEQREISAILRILNPSKAHAKHYAQQMSNFFVLSALRCQHKFEYPTRLQETLSNYFFVIMNSCQADQKHAQATLVPIASASAASSSSTTAATTLVPIASASGAAVASTEFPSLASPETDYSEYPRSILQDLNRSICLLLQSIQAQPYEIGNERVPTLKNMQDLVHAISIADIPAGIADEIYRLIALPSMDRFSAHADLTTSGCDIVDLIPSDNFTLSSEEAELLFNGKNNPFLERVQTMLMSLNSDSTNTASLLPELIRTIIIPYFFYYQSPAVYKAPIQPLAPSDIHICEDVDCKGEDGPPQ